ncbi:MAG: ribonuclease HI family protein [bacterium]|nr:ribonuclease HI family protein [bacterium]
MADLIIYTDGGARGNPGPAGAGAVFYKDGKIVAELSKPLGRRTNNHAEYEALILALKKAKQLGFSKRSVEVRMDSELIVRQLNNRYQVKEETLWPQYMRVHNLLVSDFPDTHFVHVPREKNKEADTLANKAMDGQ